MHLSTSAVLLLVASCVAGANNKNSRLEEAFRSFTLVPILIDEVPQYEVSVRFSSEVVNLGNKIPAYSASFPPYIYYEADPKSLYTIIVTGADGDSAAVPIDREFLHACLVNTPGNNLEKSTYLTPYYPINPPPGGGYTRIVILVYKQSKKIDTNTPFLQNLNRNNTRFSTRNFAATYGLGKPLGGNFFLSQRTICPDDQEIAYTCTLQSS